MIFPLGFYQVIVLANALLSFFLGLIVFVSRRDKKGLLFTVFAFLVAFWAFFFFLSIYTSDFELARFFFRTCMIGGTLILPVFTEFVSALVERKINNWIRLGNFLLASIIIATIYTNIYAIDSGPFLGFLYWPIVAPASLLEILLYAINVTLSHWLLFIGIKSGNAVEKNRLLIVAIGTFLGYIGAASNFLLWFRVSFPPILNILIPIYVINVAYAITKHRLMDISVVISRVAAKIIAALFFIVGYLTVFWLYQTYVPHVHSFFFTGWNILYGILVFYTFSKLRFFIQTSSEKVFLRGKYNYYKELAKISDRITRNFSRENVLAALHNAFYDVVEASNPRIYLPKDFDKPEVKELLSIKKLCFKGEALILPCLFEGKTMALIVLGPKFSEDAYSDEDLRLLTNLASQTAVALDHCQLCEEMLNAQKQLLMADKLSSMGKVAAGLAHEIKNPLTAIKGMTQALARNPEDQETIRDFNAIIPKEVDRLTRLVEGLSNLGKTPKFQITKVDINTLLENNLKLFESRCRKQSINIIKEFGTLPEIETDGERLTQVFTNLILNAIQAMPDGGKLEIRTQKIEHGTTVEIADTGQGIPEDKLKDIFEPFFTTKEEGTGLGLAITHKIIKDMGGEITVESKVGEGAKFKMSVPVRTRI